MALKFRRPHAKKGDRLGLPSDNHGVARLGRGHRDQFRPVVNAARDLEIAQGEAILADLEIGDLVAFTMARKDENIRALIAVEPVVAKPAVRGVGALPAEQGFGASVAAEQVVALVPGDEIGIGAAINRIVAGSAEN